MNDAAATVRVPSAGLTLVRARRVLLALVLVACIAGGIWLGRTGHLTQDAIGGWVGAWGPWAAPAFVLAFTLGEVLHLPGMLFVFVARAAFGVVGGFLLGYGGALIAILVPFLLVRGIRSQRERVWQPRWRFLQRLLDGIETHPIRSVMILRLVLWLSPPLDYALAFTSIRTRDYMLGSALGLLPCIAAVIYGIGWFW